MRFPILLAAATTLAMLGSSATSAPWRSIGDREQMLRDRIDSGARTGQLTTNEADRLRRRFNDLKALEVTYRAGGLSAWERRDLDDRFDQLSREIAFQRRDDQVARWSPSWTDERGDWVGVNRRQREIQARIDDGVRTGRLTRGEAYSLERQFRRIARIEQRYRRDGLQGWERADLQHRLDDLTQRLQWQAHDNQYGYGYGPRSARH